MKMKANSFRMALVSWAGAAFIRGLRATMRIRYQGRKVVEDYIEAKQPFVFAFWHSQILLINFAYPGPQKEISALIGTHRDGELIAQVIRRLGHGSVRGSTTRGGTLAMRDMIRTLRSGVSLGITPDGPQGPRQKVQPGVIEMARMSGVPIVPLAFAASKKND